MSETRLPASLMVSLSNCIIGESLNLKKSVFKNSQKKIKIEKIIEKIITFMETHSKPLEAVGLLDLSESE